MSVECVVCGAKVEFSDKVQVGDLIDCENCGVELELVSKEPVSVSVFEEEEK